MQTILGANGQIATELARYLHDHVTPDLRLVSRRPQKVHDTDQLAAADLTDADATRAAVADSEIAYLTVGLPMNSALWERQFPAMMANTIAACSAHGTKLVFFDNTYMYPKTAAPQTEDTPFQPTGRKAVVRARITTMLQNAMDAGDVDAVICRAPEFYGPGRTQSLTNTAILDRLAQGRRAMIPLDAHTQRSLIWTPDASRAMGLIGNTADAYGQTWHLPIDTDRLTYAQIVEVASASVGTDLGYRTVPAALFTLGALFNPAIREAGELLPRYRQDNIFEATKFATRFPEFTVTSYRSGIAELMGAGHPRPGKATAGTAPDAATTPHAERPGPKS
ncbi:Nucleoside-diphosphate-sugar epimerase [Klenkia soli]|uniref:Nucleoside-diphosphate-sugar epimerase n=1 Tax=Klenkia soli TaxID=1052260 RepID=A0A1H0U6Q7_9ACTN|nr:NAD-dependent epimerase/dehydratase family protein [Klenkia soli]SDP61841.1 Nucleoside-diphosphate-sugar epimerase [Klenkia soli]